MSNHTEEYEVHKARIFTPTFFVLALVICLGVGIIVYRYIMGVGAVSNLSDGWPWGLWLGYDVAAGSAIACGGYVLAITVYVMNKFKYHPMIRSAVLASMFGYALAGFSVIVDIGRYWNSYGFFMPSRWQPNSVMFEVALCIMAYTFVLMIEFLPAVFERFGQLDKNWPKLAKFGRWAYTKLDKALIFIIALGVTLPSMHQSSLGSMYIIMGYKLDPLWQTMALPLLFLTNAVLMGFSIITFETVLSTRQLGRPFEKEVISLSRVIPYVVGVWIVIRLISVTVSGGWAGAFTFTVEAVWFWLELIFIAIPAYIIFATNYGKSQSGIFLCGVLLLIGGTMYRLGVYIVGFNPGDEWASYFPSINEFLITVSLIAIEILGYIVLVKLIPVLPSLKGHSQGRSAAAHK